MEPIPERLLYVVGDTPVSLLLSRSKYPVEDEHLDAIIWLKPDSRQAPTGTLDLILLNEKGERISTDTTGPITSAQVFVSVAFPDSLAGKRATLWVRWVREGRQVAETRQKFEVLPHQAIVRSGSVPITIPNTTGAELPSAPMTCGVPFPRGVLKDDRHIRLVDASGREIPLQTRVIGRWSRFGSIKWVLCDFGVPLTGKPVEVKLEYGPRISRREPKSGVTVRQGANRITLQTERLRLAFDPNRFTLFSSVQFDEEGRGHFSTAPEVISRGLASGAFVEREGGRAYRAAKFGKTRVEIEESGTEKVVLRARGWHALTPDDRFCRFDTRIVVHRASPVVRVFHTWIFTGDGNADKIRDMGLLLHTPGLAPLGFLSGWSEDAEWLPGDYLLQFDHDKAEIKGKEPRRIRRAPGVFGAAGKGMRLYVGVRDFWQNFPNELEFRQDALVVHQWPRHGKSRTHPARLKDAFRLWFAHEGKSLGFRMPDAFCEDPISKEALISERHWKPGQPESVNAQGVAKTDEIWLYFTKDDASPAAAQRVFAGLNQETIRPIVDPAWVCATGAFGELHPRDLEKYPTEEHYYELQALAPMRWVERCRVYGKWIWGDVLSRPNLYDRTAKLYRCFRKAHQGWPYTWLPFARSGDVRLLRFAQASVRHMTDVCFCHYSDERLKRPKGWWNRCLIPWAGFSGPTSRQYVDECDYLWQCYYLTGYQRAHDVIMDWADATKRSPTAIKNVSRQTVTLLRSYVEMYRATFDPWFLAAAHHIAQLHIHHHGRGQFDGHFWNPGDREFLRFTGSDAFATYYLDYARQWGGQHNHVYSGWWANEAPMIEAAAHAYLVTGDDFFLRRAVGDVDWVAAATYDGEPEYYRGAIVRHVYSAGYDSTTYNAYYLRMMPHALYAFEKAGGKPPPLPQAFFQTAAEVTRLKDKNAYRHRFPTVALLKKPDEPLVIRFTPRKYYFKKGKHAFRYRIVGPDGRVATKGKCDVLTGRDVRIPATASAGTYRVHVEGESEKGRTWYKSGLALHVPLSPPGTAEVLECGPRAPMSSAAIQSQYWFQVPAGIRSFWVDFPMPEVQKAAPGGLELQRLTVWDSQGRPAWRRQFPTAEYQGPQPLRATVKVPPEMQGRVWGVTIPGRTMGFSLDPAIPHIFATSPDRFFIPDAATHP